MMQNFELRPFQPEPALRSLVFTGTATRQPQQLLLDYHLQGNLDLVKRSALSTTCQRQHNLWRTTCFEFFLGIPTQSRYWEFNCSPSGAWNCYGFDAYRQGMREASELQSLNCEWFSSADQLSLHVNLDLTSLDLDQQPLEIGITAVLEPQMGELSYWALAHTGVQADFHRRDSFRLQSLPSSLP